MTRTACDAQYDPLGTLSGLLEHDTAQSFTDEFAEVAIDANQVIWITAANDEHGIPAPILSRMNVFEVKPPRSSKLTPSPATSSTKTSTPGTTGAC